MATAVKHMLNWCRLCRVCLTCPRAPRVAFNRESCHCTERPIRHNAREVQRNATTDFRFRNLTPEENTGLVHLLSQIGGAGAPPIEHNLTRANLCGTCQQRLRRAVDVSRNPGDNVNENTIADFRRNRSIRATIMGMQRVARSEAPAPITHVADTLAETAHNDSGSDEPAEDSIAVTPVYTDESPTMVNMPMLTWNSGADNLPSDGGRRTAPIPSSSATPTAINHASNNSSVNITIVDGVETPLLTERVAGGMSLSELLHAYYPDAPHYLLFRDQTADILVPPSSLVSRLERRNGLVVIKAYIPHVVTRAQWTIYPRPHPGFPVISIAPPHLAPQQPEAPSSVPSMSQSYSFRFEPQHYPPHSGGPAVNANHALHISDARSNSPPSHGPSLPISRLVHSPTSNPPDARFTSQLTQTTLPRLDLDSALHTSNSRHSALQPPSSKRSRPLDE